MLLVRQMRHFRQLFLTPTKHILALLNFIPIQGNENEKIKKHDSDS
jgi:hypothetical protein